MRSRPQKDQVPSKMAEARCEASWRKQSTKQTERPSTKRTGGGLVRSKLKEAMCEANLRRPSAKQSACEKLMEIVDFSMETDEESAFQIKNTGS